MTDDLKPYPVMKKSGVQWLGDVPEHWGVRRIGRVFLQRNQTGYPDLPVMEVSIRSGVRVRDMESGRKQTMSDFSKYKRACRDDVAYNMMRMWQGAVGVVPVDGLVSPAYVVAKPLPDTQPRYFETLFRTSAFMSEVDACSRGIVKDRNRLYWEDFKRITVPWPSPDEQRAIVHYAGWVDRRVRRLVRAKQRLIKLLEEQKQAIIHRAVTRGLDPTAPLKDSGIPWLGQIPAHWTYARFKRVARVSGRLVDPLEEDYSKKPLVAPNHVERGGTARLLGLESAQSQGAISNKYNVDQGQIIYCKIRPYLRKAIIAPCDCLCSADMYPVSVLSSAEMLSEFLLLVMLSVPFTEYTSECSLRAAMPKINRESLAEAPVWYPELLEQRAILTRLKDQSSKLNLAIDRARREIELLQEYRTRLISDVVTGKLDVRTAAARLPDEADATAPDDLGTDTDDPDALDDDLSPDLEPEEVEV